MVASFLGHFCLGMRQKYFCLVADPTQSHKEKDLVAIEHFLSCVESAVSTLVSFPDPPPFPLAVSKGGGGGSGDETISILNKPMK